MGQLEWKKSLEEVDTLERLQIWRLFFGYLCEWFRLVPLPDGSHSIWPLFRWQRLLYQWAPWPFTSSSREWLKSTSSQLNGPPLVRPSQCLYHLSRCWMIGMMITSDQHDTTFHRNQPCKTFHFITVPASPSSASPQIFTGLGHQTIIMQLNTAFHSRTEKYISFNDSKHGGSVSPYIIYPFKKAKGSLFPNPFDGATLK